MNRFMNYVRDINRKVGTTLTTEKAKQIRKKLILWGAIALIAGSILAFVGTALVINGFKDTATSTMSEFNNDTTSVCPEMGEEGWFECEQNESNKEFDNFNKKATESVGNMFTYIIIGFLIDGVAGFLVVIGIMAIQAGLAVLITGEGAKFLDTAPKCPNCGDPIEENEIYCNKCGEDLRNKKKCKSCGTQNDVNDKFCRNCGKELE